jgi:CheY-like chemotaxis protein
VGEEYQQEADRMAPPAQHDGPSPPPHILLVEDDPAARALLSRLLRAAGFGVVVAEDGVAALDAIADRLPDLILTDVRMPRLDGVTLIRRLRRLGHAIPAVLMSSDCDAAAALPDVPCLPKPIDLVALYEVASAIGLRRRCGRGGEGADAGGGG